MKRVCFHGWIGVVAERAVTSPDNRRGGELNEPVRRALRRLQDSYSGGARGAGGVLTWRNVGSTKKSPGSHRDSLEIAYREVRGRERGAVTLDGK